MICGTLLEVNVHRLGASAAEAKTMMDSLQADFNLMTDLINRTRKTKYTNPVLIYVIEDMSTAMRPGASGFPRFQKDIRGA